MKWTLVSFHPTPTLPLGVVYYARCVTMYVPAGQVRRAPRGGEDAGAAERLAGGGGRAVRHRARDGGADACWEQRFVVFSLFFLFRALFLLLSLSFLLLRYQSFDVVVL